MTHRALVIPTAVDQPCTTIEWDREGGLLRQLYAAIGCETLDSFPFRWHTADLRAWQLPGLATVCERLAVPAPDHTAEGDVAATAACFAALAQRQLDGSGR